MSINFIEYLNESRSHSLHVTRHPIESGLFEQVLALEVFRVSNTVLSFMALESDNFCGPLSGV